MKPSRAQVLLLLFGGILPVIAFALVEEFYGVICGTIAGMVFGLGEVVFEKLKFGKVSGVTWFSNVLVLALGVASLWSTEGIWFKLQPAILLFSMAGVMLGSSLIKKPFLAAMARKQNPNLPEPALEIMNSMNTRLGLFFIFLSALSAWAALKWSTEAWAFLKSIGVFLLLLFYMAAEIFYRRFRVRQRR